MRTHELKASHDAEGESGSQRPAPFTNEDEPTVYDPMSAPLRFCPDLAEYLWESGQPTPRSE
jgi:hypothetical protein